jgi:hypothetical protein
MIENSLRQYGAGRSILIDKNGRILAGNKTAENAGSIGLDDLIVVQTDGTKLVAVQRMDLDLTTDKAAKELAIADNRASQVSLNWDIDVLKELDGEVDLKQFWSEDELKNLFGDEEKPLDTLEQEMDLSYKVIVQCHSEAHQGEIIQELEDRGLKCTLLIS